MSEFQIIENSTSSRYNLAPNETSMPEKWAVNEKNKNTRYVKLTYQNSSKVFKISIRQGTASSNQIFIADGVFSVTRNMPEDVTIQNLTLGEYRHHRLFHSETGQLTLLGLLLAVFGFLISISFFIGEALPLVFVGPNFYSLAQAAAKIMELIGVVLIFWKGVLSDTI